MDSADILCDSPVRIAAAQAAGQRVAPGYALGAAEERSDDEDEADSDDEEADEIDPDFDPDDDVTMRDPEPTSRKRKAPPAPRPKRRRKTKAAPVEPVLSEYELGRRAKIKRNNKFLVSARTQRLHSIASRRPTHWSIILGGAAVPAEGADAASPFHRIATTLSLVDSFFRRRSRTTSTPGGT